MTPSGHGANPTLRRTSTSSGTGLNAAISAQLKKITQSSALGFAN